MHPQHMQSASVLHLPLVTAMTGQVKVAVFRSVLSHRFPEHVVVHKGERSSTFQLPPIIRLHYICNTSTWETVLSGKKARTPKQSKPAITHTDMCQHVRAMKTGHMTAYSGTG